MTLTPQELKGRIAGIIPGLPTLFNPDYSLNHAGMATHVNFLIDSGIQTLMLSLGVSELRFLSHAEVVAVTKTVVNAAAGRAAVITSTSEWWTGESLAFVKAVEDVGADGCIIVAPGRLYTSYRPSVHDDVFVKHYETIAQATRIGLVVHERNVPGWAGPGGPFTVSLMDRLAGIDHVVGVKMEGGNTYYAQEMVRKVRDRLAIIADWGEEFFLFAYDYGVAADISGVAQFAPRVALLYWDALRRGDLAEARRLTNEVLIRYYATVVKMDWVAAMKASMEFVGLPASPMRPPSAQLTEPERAELRRAMQETGLL